MPSRMVIKTTEELAEWYSQKYTEMGDGWNTPAEECNRHLDELCVPFDESKRLLDVGCGAGHFLAEAEKRVECTGIEISKIGVDLSRHRLQNASILHASIEQHSPFGLVETYDYITSIGSLEHVVDLDAALNNIRDLLKPTGKWYFYCPNELWIHQDQPNERTMTDAEWTELFEQHGLIVKGAKRWGDNTAFWGMTIHAPVATGLVIPRNANIKINAGSGQRPFDRKQGWINVDVQSRWSPDVVADWNNLSIFEDGSVDMVVSHHSLEHVGCGEGDGFIKEAHRVLKPGGNLLVFVPDLRALAERWLSRQIDDYIFFVNIYGAYMGNESDRHKWAYSRESLRETMAKMPWSRIKPFDWREIAGAPIGRDFWILGMEAVK